MKKTGLFYGTTSGRTKKVAEMIRSEFGQSKCDIFNIKDIQSEDILKFDNLIFGTSAWGVGDMQDDWEAFIDELVDLDLSGKKIALFGLGDQKEYPGSFADGLGALYCLLPDKDKIVGHWPKDEYKYYFSSAEKDGEFVGLVIDEENQSKLTTGRVKKWVAEIQAAFK